MLFIQCTLTLSNVTVEMALQMVLERERHWREERRDMRHMKVFRRREGGRDVGKQRGSSRRRRRGSRPRWGGWRVARVEQSRAEARGTQQMQLGTPAPLSPVQQRPWCLRKRCWSHAFWFSAVRAVTECSPIVTMGRSRKQWGEWEEESTPGRKTLPSPSLVPVTFN